MEPRRTDRALPHAFAALEGRSALVTGAAGFIGGHLLRRLEGYGLDVVGGVENPEQQRVLAAAGHRAEVLDLAGDERWDERLRGRQIVYHLAAKFQEVEAGAACFERVNHLGTVRLAAAAARAGVERFVHCSTVGVHGDVLEIPARETSPLNPMDVYHRTKLAGEQGVLGVAAELPADGMVVTVNRPAMVYGPGDRRMLRLFKSVLERRFVMIGDGRTLAHLGHVEDQTDSLLLSAVAPRERVHRECFNIASGEPVSLTELVGVIAEVGGVPPPRLRLPVAPVWLAAAACELAFRPFGVRPPLFRRRVGFFTHNRAFDLSKARERMGFESRWPLREGVASTIAAYRKVGWL